MKIHKVAVLLFLGILAFLPHGFSLTPVEDSAEDIYWAAPMTVHDYDKNTDLHNIAISTVSMIELEFLKLGDALFNFTTQSERSPLSRSMDSLEYAYSRLPRIAPVRWFGQLWDALQLRQLSLSDARVAGSVFFAAPYGGATSMMQVRANKLIIFVEDTLDGLDRAAMLPLNWGVSSLRDKPTQLKTLGYAADGLGILRRGIFQALNYLDHELTLLGSDILFGVKKVQDTMIRKKRKKLHGHLPVYAKMPLTVFRENRAYFDDPKNSVTVGTPEEWQVKIREEDGLLPDSVREFDPSAPLEEIDAAQAIFVSAEYTFWEKTPRELKRYIITPEEFKELMEAYRLQTLSRAAE